MTQSNSTPPSILFYISTGQGEVFYTLRSVNTVQGVVQLDSDVYIKNLSTDEDLAIKYAERYVEKLKKLMPNVELILDNNPESHTFIKHGSKLKGHEVNQLRLIQSGKMPFGKHQYQRFDDVPVDYVLWAIKSMHDSLDVIKRNLSSALFAVAVDLEYVKTMEDVEKALNIILKDKAKDSKSEFIGNIKDRVILDAKVVSQKSALTCGHNGRDTVQYSITLVSGGNMLYYRGGINLGAVDETLKLKVTITDHFELNGIKFTRFNRPVLV